MKRESKMVWVPIRLVLVLCWLVVCGFGCSSVKDSELLGTNQDSLTFPITVTLSTPTSVSPLAPVLEGANTVQLGARAEVVSGLSVAMGSGLLTQPDAKLNETWSRGTAALNDRVQVRGTLHARTRTLGNGVVIQASDLNPAIDPPATLSWEVRYPSGTASDVPLGVGASRTLLPGKYGTVTLNSQSTLTLVTGTYYLTALTVQSAASVKLDQTAGPIVIYTTSGVTLRGTFAPLSGSAPPDLAIVHLGTSPIVVESLFNGAIVAPFASLTLRSLTLAHTGFFAAKDAILDAGAKVNYRAPLAVVGAAKPPGATCRELLPASVPNDVATKYCATCVSPADSDLDSVQDCLDGCPSDPNKTKPGLCGCGIPETDTDGDRIPDCLDQCELDPNNNVAGQCGCVRGPRETRDLKPAGTPCTDTGCPQTGATCNASGVCGTCTLPGCRLIRDGVTSYWFCPGPATQSSAAQTCRSRNMHLARINSISEDRFIQRYVTAPTWIGANSITTSGAWRWTTPSSNNGDLFWQGGATGAQRNSLFSNWKSGAPAAARCAVLGPLDGRWTDVDCNEALGFVCEAPPNAVPPPPSQDPPGANPQPRPPERECVSHSAAKLPDEHTAAALAKLQADYDKTQAVPPVFEGAAADPVPEGSVCPSDTSSDSVGFNPSDPNAGCKFVVSTAAPANFECMSTDECKTYGATLVCRQVKDNPGCTPDNANPHDGACKGHARCGTLDCPPNLTPTRCEQIEICNPGSETTATIDPALDPQPALFDPADLFTGAPPTPDSIGVYEDPPGGVGKEHKWCSLTAQRPVPDATQSKKNNEGAGKTQNVSFRFDPDLVFDAKVNPLSLGETNLSIHAAAQLVAGVKVEDLFGSGVGFDQDILRAVADIRAERCTLSNDQTKFEVFGVDFIPPDNEYIFNTAKKPIAFLDDLDLVDETRACNEAVGKFVTYANRAKKAFRDAQQLLSAYHGLQAGTNLGELCNQVMSIVKAAGVQEISFFPGGLDCPANEPAEITINRFLDYYQAPGYGQVEQLRAAINDLQAKTNQIIEKLKVERTINIVDIGRQESQTIVSIPFFIGPVPCQLQVDVFYGYGVKGFFKALLQYPFNPLSAKPGDEGDIAKVSAGVMPHANAGLAVFAGAGTNLGAFSATLGIEGSIKLADLKAPIFAGAGVAARIVKDVRPFENKVGPPVSLAGDALGLEPLTHFGIPTSFKFSIWYDYGAALHIDDILAGSLNARLRIKFLFFSRTWRKQIVKFNGFKFDRNLVSGKVGSAPGVGVVPSEPLDPKDPGRSSTDKVQGTSEMGIAESQTPLAVLVPLAPPVEPPDLSASVPFDATAVVTPFYDALCCARPEDPAPPDVRDSTCIAKGVNPLPGDPPPCCSGSTCKSVGIDIGWRCVPDCHATGSDCAADGECCSDLICRSSGKCGACTEEEQSCTSDSDCCGRDDGSKCSPTNGPPGVCWRCRTGGEECDSDADCCGVVTPGSGGFGCGDPDASGKRVCAVFIP
jgi:hypothetical protein